MRRIFLVLFGATLFFVAHPGRASAQTTDTAPATRTSQLEDENKRLRADADFAQRRMALLETEAERLRQVVRERENADALAADRARREGIEREVERLRGLRFLHPVDYHEIDRTELPAILRQKLSQQVPDQEFDRASVAFAALGILPAGFALKKTYLSLLGEQIGAFYDQHEKGLFTFSGHPLAVSTNRVIMAHELTHALDDQHFELARLPLEAKGNDDRVLAATALVEGDATLVMNQYMTGDLSAATLRDALSQAVTTDVRQLAAAPLFLRETLLFPYLRGQEFAQMLYAKGGWQALDAAFQHPPSSTAQILHPALYFANPREEPIAIEFPDTTLDGEKPVQDNVLGEFGTRVLLEAQLHDKARAAEAAAGWRGDRYLVYQHGQSTSYVWRIAFRDRAAARRFFAAMHEVDANRYHLTESREVQVMPDRNPLDGKSEDAAVVLKTAAHPPGRELRICVTRENEVLVIDAEASFSDAMRERFAPGIRFSEL